MFKYRFLSFVVLIGLVAAIFFWSQGGYYLFLASASVASGLALWELGKICSRIGLPVAPKFLGVITGAAVLLTVLDFEFLEKPATLCALLLIMVPAVLLIFGKTELFKNLLGSFGLFATFGVSFLILVSFYTEFYTESGFAAILFYLIVVTKAMDIGGYIFGRLTSFLPAGNHKLAPSISPQKSWEGTIGGLIFSVCASMLFDKVEIFVMPIWGYALLGLLFGGLSLAGDLTESALKRKADVKDSGSYIPGMGGMLDVLDSFIYVGPVAAILVYFL